VGNTVRLNQTPVPLSVDASGEPDFFEYIGTTTATRDDSGAATYRVCALEPIRTVIFSRDDIEIPYQHSFSHTYSAASEIGAGINADIREALEEANVSADVVERLEADITSAANRIGSTNITVSAQFRHYRLNAAAIRRLRANGPDEAAVNCRRYLEDNPDQRMFSGLTGFYFSDAQYNQEVSTDVVAELAAKIKAEDDGADIVGLESTLRRVVATTLDAQSDPYFRVVGFSFYAPNSGN
jgi:hypothetical protein